MMIADSNTGIEFLFVTVGDDEVTVGPTSLLFLPYTPALHFVWEVAKKLLFSPTGGHYFK